MNRSIIRAIRVLLVSLCLGLLQRNGPASEADEKDVAADVARYSSQVKDPSLRQYPWTTPWTGTFICAPFGAASDLYYYAASDTRKRAAKALGDLGAKAKEAVPQLVATLNDEDEHVGEAAFDALVQIGPAAVPALRATLRDKSIKARQDAAAVLGMIGSEAKAAIPELLALLKDKDAGKHAAWALGRIGGPAVITALLACSKDQDARMREQAAIGLGVLRDKPKEVIKALGEALKDKEIEVRQAAVRAWSGPEAKDAVPDLIAALRDETIRGDVVIALSQIGAPAIDPLLTTLKDQDPAIRIASARALELMGPKATLKFRAGKGEPERPSPKMQPAVGHLIEALKDKEWEVRRAVAHALHGIGPEAAAAEPALIVALKKDERGPVRYSAALALRDIGPRTQEAIDALIAALKDDYGDARMMAAQALGECGPKAKAAVDPLIIGLEDSDMWTSAARALGQIRSERKKTNPALVGVLQRLHKEEPIIFQEASKSLLRRATLRALGEFGPEATDAVPEITYLYKKPEFRTEAGEALKKIDPDAAKKAGGP
jgi:HEAT repeat protein